jgi:serine protease AprX
MFQANVNTKLLKNVSAIRIVYALVILALALPALAPTPARWVDPAGKVHAFLKDTAARNPGEVVRVIVQKSAQSDGPEEMTRDMGGKVLSELSIINAFVAQMPSADIDKLASSSDVRWISPDAPVQEASKMSQQCGECIDTSNLISAYPQSVGATRVWNTAPYLQGQNVTVATIDSGVNADHRDLRGSNGTSRVIAEVNVNSNSNNTDDGYGHGTHVAGIIGGNGNASNGGYIGIAPKVNLVNVKVGDDTGAMLESDVVAGIQWIYDNHDTYDIKVVNLSLNTSFYNSYLLSPLDAALEILWFNRIVVVVSAGNNGLAALYPPANDPFVITVGAVDDHGTASIRDDTIPSYSAYGPTLEGNLKPDLVAPGTNIISDLASTSSVVYQQHPANRVNNNYFRMSGTSMAAPMVAGAVALLLQDEPNLNPDQVKYRIKATANHNIFQWPRYNFLQAGAGYLDIYAAINGRTTQTANTGTIASLLLWTGILPPNWGTTHWDSVHWDSVNWSSVNWSSVNWSSADWGSDYWSR